MSKDNINKTIMAVDAKSPFRVEEKVGMHIEASPIIFRRAEELRSKEIEAEKVLWEELKGKMLGGFKFRRQHPAMKYVLDFYCHQFRLAIEIDGEYHFTKEQEELDTIRTEHLREYGIQVIRFTNNDVEIDVEQVKNKILATIDMLKDQ